MKTRDFINHFEGKYSTKQAAAYLDLHPHTLYMWGAIVPERYAYKLHVELGLPLEKEDYEKDGAE